jgi:hypothetical protein
LKAYGRDNHNTTANGERKMSYKSKDYGSYRVEINVETPDGSERMIGSMKGNNENEVRAKLREEWGGRLLGIELVRPIKV